jgi:uncharacterized protein YkwD
MFRKIWKTIKVFVIIAIILVCIPHSILPHQSSDTVKDDLKSYQKLNDSEIRLSEFKDNDESLRLKLTQLEIINNSRKKFKADPVRLDILASRVANKMCREAAEGNFMGHWNLRGEKPYQRYALAGGHDHVSENAFGEWSSDTYSTTESVIASMMKAGHLKFMAEKAPYDGHKKTVIDNSHNFVGIGYCVTGKQFRYYEEYIDRYFEFEKIPTQVNTDEQCSITIKTNSDDFLYYLVIYRDNFPESMTASEISSRGSYDDYTNEEYKKMTAWELSRFRNGTTYKIPLQFSKAGMYYIQIYSDKKELTGPASWNTRGKSAKSGIVIRVN